MRSAWHHWVPAVIERKLVRLTFDLVVIPHNWDPSLLSMISFSVRKASSSRHAIWPGSSMMYFFVAELPFSFKPDRFNIMGGWWNEFTIIVFKLSHSWTLLGVSSFLRVISLACISFGLCWSLWRCSNVYSLTESHRLTGLSPATLCVRVGVLLCLPRPHLWHAPLWSGLLFYSFRFCPACCD